MELFDYSDFSFDEKEHVYTLKGKELTPTTGFISQFKKPFDEDYWATYKAPKLGMTPDEVKQMWKAKGEASMAIGTEVHLYAEQTIRKEDRSQLTTVLAHKKANCFQRFYDNHHNIFEEVYPEIRVYDEEFGIGGMVDLLFRYKDLWYIVDWKTNKEISTSNPWDNLLPPFWSLQASDLNYYSLQLSMYKLMIERNTGIKIAALRVINLREEGEAIVHSAKDLSIQLLKQIENGKQEI